MSDKKDTILMRIGRQSLGFAAYDDSEKSGIRYEPYVVGSGISIAANLREAFKRSVLLSNVHHSAKVFIDSKVMLLPTSEFNETEIVPLYQHAFALDKSQTVVHSVVPELSAVAVYAVNSDLITVLNDNFNDVRIFPLSMPTWTFFANRKVTSSTKRLYVYYHDKQIEITSYGKNRFKFYNSFDVKHLNDAVYFILSVWKQLDFDQETDELYVAGNCQNSDKFSSLLCKYLRSVFMMRPRIEFNQHRYTLNETLPFDLMAYTINY